MYVATCWLKTCCVDQDVLQLTEYCLPLAPSVGIKAYVLMLGNSNILS